jgi:signal transduction histidine kinase
LPHIFDRFHRGTRSVQEGKHGSGLGLAIVKRILEIHGVSISVSSRVKEGTSFAFDLPGKPVKQTVQRALAQ